MFSFILAKKLTCSLENLQEWRKRRVFPQKDAPILVYDGDCGFCKMWVDHWKKLTVEKIQYAPYQEISQNFPEIPLENFQKSVVLIEVNGKIYSGAEAIFRILARIPGKSWWLRLYLSLPGFAFISELVYLFIANHRSLAFIIAKIFKQGRI